MASVRFSRVVGKRSHDVTDSRYASPVLGDVLDKRGDHSQLRPAP